jgi:hypothetical protein
VPQQQGEFVVGRLLSHGRDHYKGQAGQPLSYFIRIQTLEGRRTFWGKGLDAALHAGVTRPKVGEMVGIRRVGTEPVRYFEKVRDRSGQVMAEVLKEARRQLWQVETPAFFAKSKRQARQARDAQMDAKESLKNRPELRSTFVNLRVARLVAEKKIADPKDRERYLQLLEETIGGSIRRGEPVPEVRMRTRDRGERTR